jgi:hypothetical protein
MRISKKVRTAVAVASAAFFVSLSATAAEAQRTYRGEPGPRLRLGGEAGVGAAVGDTNGGAFTLAGQLGLQASHLFAIYWKPGLNVAGWAADDDDLDTYAFTSQMGMADFTFGHFFQVGGGAGIDIGRFGVCESNGCEMHSGQVKPSIEGRMGFVIPMPSNDVRWGIPIVFNAHTTFLFGERIHLLTLSTGILRY